MEEETVFHGSGNVFADLGLSNPEERLAKAELASAIRQSMEARGLTEAEAAEVMGIDLRMVSKIVRGRLSEFSTERLLSLLMHLGLDVEILVYGNSSQAGHEGVLTVTCV